MKTNVHTSQAKIQRSIRQMVRMAETAREPLQIIQSERSMEFNLYDFVNDLRLANGLDYYYGDNILKDMSRDECVAAYVAGLFDKQDQRSIMKVTSDLDHCVAKIIAHTKWYNASSGQIFSGHTQKHKPVPENMGMTREQRDDLKQQKLNLKKMQKFYNNYIAKHGSLPKPCYG